MSAPALASVAAELYEQTQPLAADDARQGFVFATLCAAIGAMFQDVDDLIRDTDQGPGWSALVDVDRVPDFAMPWLAQIAGVRLKTGAAADVWREQIRRVDGQSRGRPAAFIAAGQQHLTGAQTVRLVEQAGGNAYHVTVITRTGETPDAAQTLKDFMAAKPAGLVISHVVSDDVIWDEATLAWDAVDGAVTWDNVELGDV